MEILYCEYIWCNQGPDVFFMSNTYSSIYNASYSSSNNSCSEHHRNRTKTITAEYADKFHVYIYFLFGVLYFLFIATSYVITLDCLRNCLSHQKVSAINDTITPSVRLESNAYRMALILAVSNIWLGVVVSQELSTGCGAVIYRQNQIRLGLRMKNFCIKIKKREKLRTFSILVVCPYKQT